MNEDVYTCRANDPIALHVLVVGFHHKKGMQVEFSYPPLSSGENTNPCDLPDKWKHLPSLCLPDGAHNHESDTVYFHLPDLINNDQTVFGVSCYRQIDAEKVTNKTADITRNTVQKSVCVLTTLPIYGYVQERLKATTKVYFKEADFSDVRDLEGLYHDLNNTNWKDRLMHVDLEDKYGICVSEAVKIFGRNILVLFKLLLLEQRVLFYNSEVACLGKTITSLLALLPANLPEGLAHAAASKYLQVKSNEDLAKRFTNARQESYVMPSNECDVNIVKEFEGKVETLASVSSFESAEEAVEQKECNSLSEGFDTNVQLGKIINVTNDVTLPETAMEAIMSGSEDLSERRSSVSSLTSVTSRGSMMTPFQSPDGSQVNLSTKLSSIKGRLSGAINYWTGKEKTPSADQPSTTTTPNPSPSDPFEENCVPPLNESIPEEHIGNVDLKSETNQLVINTEAYTLLEPEECGLPLQIFTKGNLLHPYLSLQYLDVLTSPSTRAFVAGASNALFIHKKNFADVVIQLDEGKIEVHDPELKKQLSLSTEDLRFAENLVRQVDAVNASANASSPLADVFLDGVGWMGGEEWLRLQFKVYLLAMLRTSLCPENCREHELYNNHFMSAWMETHNYRMWLAGGPYDVFSGLTPGHPNAGHISITDMRIRLSHSIGLDRSRRLNQTFANTGTAVVKTKEVVGGAITSAKGALTNLWSSFTTTNATDKCQVDEAQEVTPDDEVESSPQLVQDGIDEPKSPTVKEIELLSFD